MEQHEYEPTAGFRRRVFFGPAAVFTSLLFAFTIGSLPPAIAAGDDCPALHPTFIGAAAESRAIDVKSDSAKIDLPLRILAIGSSSTQGIGASAPNFTYPAQLQADLISALGRQVAVENAGIGGETVSTTLARLKAALKTERPDLVIWQVGTNDAVRGDDEGQFRALVEEGVDIVREAKIPLVLLDQQFYPGIKDIGRYERFVRIVEDVGAERHAPVFPRYAMMKEWGAESPTLLRAMLWKDAFHMSDRGYGCLARDLAADVAPLWARRMDVAEKPGAVSIVK
jgi:acyl-CoA thioesterase I